MTHQFNLKTLKSQNGKKYGMCLFYLPSPLHTSFTMDSDLLPETLKYFSKLIEIAFPLYEKVFARKSKNKKIKKRIKQKEKMNFFFASTSCTDLWKPVYSFKVNSENTRTRCEIKASKKDTKTTSLDLVLVLLSYIEPLFLSFICN